MITIIIFNNIKIIMTLFEFDYWSIPIFQMNYAVFVLR